MIYDTPATTSRGYRREPPELMGRMGHSTTSAALIYQHRTTERDRFIAAAMSEIVKTELGEADRPSGTQRAREGRDAS
jgi:hypothetical protein